MNGSDLSLKNRPKCVKDKLITIDADKWKSKLWNDVSLENGNKLRTYIVYKTDLITEHYVKLNMERSRRRILAKFRSGSLPLVDTQNLRCHLIIASVNFEKIILSRMKYIFML